MKANTIFETETCSRCGGSGRHSYCQMYGDICFKCRGKGIVLTKRGNLAKMLYTRLASRPASQIVAGDVIWVDGSPLGGKGGWQAVEVSSRPNDEGGYVSPEGGVYQSVDAWYIQTSGMGQHVSQSDAIRVRQSVAERTAKMDIAIQYQRSLTKAGKLDTRLAKFMREVAYA